MKQSMLSKSKRSSSPVINDSVLEGSTSGQDRRMSINLPDKLLLDPVEKFQKYNRFPWKMMVQVLLIGLTTALVFLVITDVSDYRRNLSILWKNLFLQSDGDYEGLDPPDQKYLYDIEQVQSFIAKSVDNYYSVNNKTLEYYNYLKHDNGSIFEPKVSVTPLSYEDFKGDLLFYINQQSLGPISDVTQFKSLLNNIAYFQILYEVQSTVPTAAITNYNCFYWRLNQIYEFRQRGFLQASLKIETKECGSQVEKVYRLYDWLHILTIIFGLVSLILELRYIYKFSLMFTAIRKKYRSERKAKQHQYQESLEQIQRKNLKERTRVKRNTMKIGSGQFSIKKSATQVKVPLSPRGSKVQKSTTSVADQGEKQEGGASFISKQDPFSQSVFEGSSDQKFSTVMAKNKDKYYEMKDDRIIRWEDLSFSHKASLFNKWSIIGILGAFFQILASFLAVAQLDPLILEYQTLIGFGCMLAWINITRYIEYYRESAVFIHTLGRSMPYVWRFLLGVFPLFMGYMFLGLALFWDSKRFTTPSGAMFTLFAVLNGDMVYDTYNDLHLIDFVLAQIYLYSFIILFINVVQNVFITIIGEGFISAKYKSATDQIEQAPTLEEPDLREVHQENEKKGIIYIGATGSLTKEGERSFSEKKEESSKLLPKAKKEKKQKQMEYKSKLALYRIIHESDLKREERAEDFFMKETEEESKIDDSSTLLIKSKESQKFLVEEENEMKRGIRRFGRSIRDQIYQMEQKIDENISSFDDEMRESFLYELKKIKREIEIIEDRN